MLARVAVLVAFVKVVAEDCLDESGLLQSRQAGNDLQLGLQLDNTETEENLAGEPGTVDGLYTFGAPGVASPGLVLTSADGGCFPGARVVTLETSQNRFGRELLITDPFAWITRAVNLWHPRLSLYLLDVNDPSKDRIYPCTHPDVERLPNSTLARAWRTDLHSGAVLDKVAARSDNAMVRKLSNWALDLSYERDAKKGAELARQGGFRVVGAAKYRSGDSALIFDSLRWPLRWWEWGTQVSYLVQHPDTLECVVTFQGTYDVVDWTQNARGVTRPFCGLTLPDVQDPTARLSACTYGSAGPCRWPANDRPLSLERGPVFSLGLGFRVLKGLPERVILPQRGFKWPTQDRCCRVLPVCTGDCNVQRPGDSFVHTGFWAELYRMTRHPSWQQNIRTRLPYCKRVSVFGHSLGGAMANLFTACVGRAPKNGSFGFEDYDALSWKARKPKLLPENATFGPGA